MAGQGAADPALDVVVAAALCGAIGARAGHVALNWAYFSEHIGEVWSLSSGGLNWHGALIGCLFGAQAVAEWRRLDAAHLRDSLALCLPIGAVATWAACAEATCGYGIEVRTLADYPAWLAVESLDIYGVLAPRLNLPLIGAAYAGALGILVLLFDVAAEAEWRASVAERGALRDRYGADQQLSGGIRAILVRRARRSSVRCGCGALGGCVAVARCVPRNREGTF